MRGIKKLFVAYPNFKFNWASCILSSHPKHHYSTWARKLPACFWVHHGRLVTLTAGYAEVTGARRGSCLASSHAERPIGTSNPSR